MNEATSQRVLVIGNELDCSDRLTAQLRDNGIMVVEVRSCAEAWDQLLQRDISLLVLNISAGSDSAWQLLESIGDRFAEIAVVAIVDESSAPRATKTLAAGASCCLPRTADANELSDCVRRMLGERQLKPANAGAAQAVDAFQPANDQELIDGCDELICRLIAAATLHEEETYEHAKRVGLMSETLALVAGWSAPAARQLRLAAALHDIGKSTIPPAIVQKQDKLNSVEFEIMKRHALRGGRMLAGSASPLLQLAQTIAVSHHEKWDGSGYPYGLSGVNIPQAARIVAIADVYDSLTHDRCYRPAMSEAFAISIMLDSAGTHFDPELVEMFVAEIAQMRRISAQFPEAELEMDSQPEHHAPAGKKAPGKAIGTQPSWAISGTAL